MTAKVTTLEGSTIVEIDDDAEAAYKVAFAIWNLLAGDHHCDGLSVWYSTSEDKKGKPDWLLFCTINYLTHER